MVYDAKAQAVAIKAIGTVESSFDYTAINYNDPITVGIMQWYGTRASALLRRMRGQQAVLVSERTNFLKDYAATNIAYWVADAGTLSGGAGYIQVRASADAQIFRLRSIEDYPVRQGDTVSFSIEVSAQYDNAQISTWLQGTVATTGAAATPETQNFVMNSADPYVRITHTAKITGSGTIRVGVRARNSTGVVTGNSFRVRRGVITINKPVDPPFSGATTSTTTHKYAWLGDANNSYSTETVYGAAGGQWTGVAASINTALDQHNDSDNWWTDRFLTRAEGESLKPMLSANKLIQNAQAIEDMESYKNSAVSLGIDPDGNTKMMLLFFTALHQSPARARRLIATIGPASSFDRLHEALLNEDVFGRYKTRYNTAYTIINNMDSEGVDTGTPPVPVPDPGGDVSTDPEVTNPGDSASPSGVGLVTQQGDNLHIQTKDGTVVGVGLPGGSWAAFGTAPGTTEPTPLPPEPNPTDPPPVDPGSGGAGDDVRAALAKFVTDRIGKYAYSQGGTRMEPDRNNYTDCSGLVRYAYQKVTGVEIGTYTVAQLEHGTEVLSGSGAIDESKLLLGDLVLYNWRGGRDSVDHVEMYVGNSQVCGHGGPGNGPTMKTLQGPAGNAINWYVRRYV